MKKRYLIPAAALFVALVTTAGSCQTTTSDRSGDAGGRDPDVTSDATQVTLYRNVDNVPNVATFCLDGIPFAATLSADGTRAPALVPIPRDYNFCQR